MKKIFFAGILGLLFASASFAQPKIGITAGLNASNIVGGEGSDTKYKAGFQAGLVADFGITENFSIIPELLFSQRGSKYKMTALLDIIEVNYSTTLNYLQLPVNAAYKFDTGYGSKLFVFAGPYIGYALSGTLKIGDKSTDIKFGSEKTETKPFDFGINIGVGYEFEKIFFKLQCNPGLVDLENYENSSAKNMNVAVTVGYYFF